MRHDADAHDSKGLNRALKQYKEHPTGASCMKQAGHVNPEAVVQFDDDLEEEATLKKPFWKRWKFYRNTFVFLFRQAVLHWSLSYTFSVSVHDAHHAPPWQLCQNVMPCANWHEEAL